MQISARCEIAAYFNSSATLFDANGKTVSGISCWNGSPVEGRFHFCKLELDMFEIAMLLCIRRNAVLGNEATTREENGPEFGNDRNWKRVNFKVNGMAAGSPPCTHQARRAVPKFHRHMVRLLFDSSS